MRSGAFRTSWVLRTDLGIKQEKVGKEDVDSCVEEGEVPSIASNTVHRDLLQESWDEGDREDHRGRRLATCATVMSYV